MNNTESKDINKQLEKAIERLIESPAEYNKELGLTELNVTFNDIKDALINERFKYNIERIILEEMRNNIENLRKAELEKKRVYKLTSILGLCSISLSALVGASTVPTLAVPLAAVAGVTTFFGFLFKTIKDDKKLKESKIISKRIIAELDH